MADLGHVPLPAIEVLPGQLFALGGAVKLDGRVSWAPASGGWQPVHCYLLPAEDPPTLVDTGLAAHRTQIVEDLRRLIPAGKPLTVFLTRSEHDCSGNVGAVMGSFQLDRLANLYTGGGYNPFDGFEEAATAEGRTRLPLKRMAAESAQRELRQFEVAAPPFRTLTAYWPYHAATRTLFSSDLFGHTAMAGPDSNPIIDGDDDSTTVESVKAHLLAKFFWLEGARTAHISEKLAAVFDRFDIEVIAPTHGRILRGRATVRRHYALFQQALRDLGCDRAGG